MDRCTTLARRARAFDGSPVAPLPFVRLRSLPWLLAICVLALPAGVVHADDAAAPASAGEPCLSDGLGAPACAVGAMPGAVADPERPGRHVGNPIEVVSGNKYQRDVDYAAFASGLAFVRHYNSLLSDVNHGLGAGWRHSYQVSIARVDPDTLRLTPADGRVLHFSRAAGSAGPYLGPTTASGEIVIDPAGVRWQVPDGRVFSFSRGWLTGIDFNDSRGQLRIARSGARVDAIADSRGAVLQLHWAERARLPDYDGPQRHWLPFGALEALTLPGGHRVSYGYDAGGRPRTVDYPDGEGLRYRHEEGGRPALLIERQASWERKVRRWAYDGNGLAVASSGAAGLRIQRDASGKADTVTWTDGHPDADERPIDDRASGSSRSGQAGAVARRRSVPPSPASRRMGRTGRVDTLAAQVVRRVTSDPDSGGQRSTITIEGREIAVDLLTDRLGRIVRLRIGGVSSEALIAGLASGSLPACEADDGTLTLGNRLTTLVDGRAPCRADALAAASLRVAVQAVADDGSAGALAKHRFATRLPAAALGIGPLLPGLTSVPPDPCMMPAGEDCDTLTEKHAMAQLSQCAYRTGTCDTDYRPVSAAAVYLDHRDFHDGGFDAELYHDWRNDRYIVAFRGTDGVGDDWENNFRQGAGKWARQYDLASRLSGRLDEVLPDTEIIFTGHSLGGGLATLAALEAGSKATVFNSAALHPDTADSYGLANEFAAAPASIDVVRTYSDPVSLGNSVAEQLGIVGAQRAPGSHTVLADPDAHWVAGHSTLPLGLGAPLVWHSIDAVIESLARLLEKFCGLVRYPY